MRDSETPPTFADPLNDVVPSVNHPDSPSRPRLVSLDALRGVIMILMALDHCAYFVAKAHPAEFWGYGLPEHAGWVSFMTRWITHLCAPGFFLLMGMGIALLGVSRTRAGWGTARIARHLAIRGFLLVLIGQTIEVVPWAIAFFTTDPSAQAFEVLLPGGGGPPMLALGVLYGLGVSMIVCGALVRLPTWALALAGMSAIILTQMLVPGAEAAGDLFSPWLRLLFIPGQTDFVIVMYPVVPWIGMALIGMALGNVFAVDSGRGYRVAAIGGASLIVLFLVVRFVGAFGNIHPWDGEGLMSLLHVTKYPPSLAFVSVTIGVDLLLLVLFNRWQMFFERRGAAVLVFGRTALFFYVLHLYVYMLVGLPFSSGTGYGLLYVMWVVGLVLLYWPCVWYMRFKSAKPADSVWRLF